MSAFIHSNGVINGIAYAMVNYCAGRLGGKWNGEDGKPDASKLADDLYMVNVESVNYRYDENTPTEYGMYAEPAEEPSPMQAYKWMRSWRYQSCESDKCERSDVYVQVSALVDAFEGAYIKAHGERPDRTDEYESCDWC